MNKEIYFIDEEHARNFRQVLLKFPEGRTNLEFQSACYILAVPMIFHKVEKYFGTFKYPVDWIWRWEWKYNLSQREDFKGDKDEAERVEIGYDLTGSMVRLGRLALHLWNGYEHFHLLDTLSAVDDVHERVAFCAIQIRQGKYMEWNQRELL